ncbi:MAG: DUF4139 domain-containing protein [Bacteroidetes bacterium]|nr:DUF4139 domain-containing protein [Bacteroidota bacterium]MBU1718790.1 DUF4139 domain-containing protein [Bacteroidota bacterium]
MKSRIFLFIAGLALSVQAFGNDTIRVETKVNTARVFLSGAEITRTSDVALQKGSNIIVFSGLSPYVDTRNIRIAASDGFLITSVSYRKKISGDPKMKEQIKLKEDSIERVGNQITLLQNEKDGYLAELSLLNKNEDLGGKENGATIEELTKATTFFREKTKEAKDKIYEIDTRIAKHSKQLKEINQRMIRLALEAGKPFGEVIADVVADAKGSCHLEVKYQVYGAGWNPIYDIAGTEVGKPITFRYNAMVYNNTGVKWEKIKVILSTGDPSLSASLPVLSSWTLNYDMPTGNEGYLQNYLNNQNQNEISSIMDSVVVGNSPQWNVNVSEFVTEFEIASEYSFPSDGRPYLVKVKQSELPASFSHYSVPKLDRDAFLLASVSGWEDLDIIDGPANIYYGNAFIGQSEISTRNLKDTLDLSLGRDRKVMISRNKRKDYSSKKTLGQTRKESFSYEIVVKNNRNAVVDIEVVDQVPVSQEKDIEVSVEEISGADQDLLSGKLSWKVKLDPGETKKFTISYSIKYPKNKSLVTRKTRSVKAARFL